VVCYYDEARARQAPVTPIFNGALAGGADYLDMAMSLSRATQNIRTASPG
jgi:hypothetical protein